MLIVKKLISVRSDHVIAQYFKAKGKGCQTQINTLLGKSRV
ncbi:BrnA antitoxin family protein [Anaerobiospirillum thomasii]